jgi:hypothetical protein|tara:strand:- start:4218 stop:4805 length:588 start_codon:yes stop_codon:yes gene_type:complete
MKFQNATLKTNSVVGVSKSPFTGEEQIVAHQGQWWTAELSVAPLERADAGAVTAWFTSLNGREKTVLFGDPAASTAQGSASSAPGTPLVNGASQTGSALVCDGAPNGATGYLKEGDYVQLGTGSSSRLYMVLEDVTSDGAGNFTLNIWPDLRSSPDNNDALTVASAVGRFRLGANAGWELSTVMYGFSFNLVEAF